MTLVSLHRASVVGATGGEFAQAASVKVSSKAAVGFIGLLPKFRLFLKCFGLDFKFSDLATLKPCKQGDADPGEDRDQLLKQLGPDHLRG